MNVPGKLWSLVLCIAAVWFAVAQLHSDDRPVALAAKSALIEVIPIEGPAVKGLLAELNETMVSLRDEQGASRTWNIADVRSLRVSAARTSDESPPVVLLGNGDALYGPLISATEDELTVNWAGLDPPQPVTIPLEFVRSFAVQQPEDEFDRLRLRRLWALLKLQDDRLISTDLTHLDGEFLGLVEDQMRLKAPLGEFSAPLSEVIAVIMNTELATTPEPEGEYVVATLTDGARVTLNSVTLSPDGQLQGRTTWGIDLDFPLQRLVRLQFFGARVIDVASLEPSRYQFTPFLTQEFPLVHHRNVNGGRLRLRDQLYATGLGVSTKSEVSYDLTGGNYVSFDAVVGVDDMTGGQGNVVFAVEIDGRRIYESAQLTGRSAPEVIGPLDVKNAKQLTLIAEFGGAGNIQDVADWCDPVLVRAAGAVAP